MRKTILCSVIGAMPIVLMGFSTGPPPKRTGNAADGGVDCTACHRTFVPANSDARGSVRIDVSNYVPGAKQTIKVIVSHPEAMRWGFEITARMASDETKTAGEFTAGEAMRVICDDGSARGSAAPCQAGQLQFAEHSDAPRTSAGAGFTFTLDWTPPATNVGDIVFYAAGNAADGNGNNQNDRIYTTVRRISPPCALTQKPAFTRVVNAASFQPAWNAGALITIFGSNFGATGATRGVTAGDIVDQKFPQALGCTGVTINGQNAPILYVQPDQINVQAPQLSSVGAATVVVTANPGAQNEMRSDPMNVTTQQAFAPAFFTVNGKTIAATSADGSKLLADPSVVPGGITAKPGDTVVLYLTGMGQTNPAYSPGDVATAAAQVSTPLTVNIGGTAVPASDIVYAGVSPQSICGLHQINVKLPGSLSDGDVPVTVMIGSVTSASGTTIPVKR